VYSNIPTQALVDIIKDIATKKEIHSEVIREMEQIVKLIIKQNYFEMNSKFYQQSEGLAMVPHHQNFCQKVTYST
jgi:hypothetical protein